MENKMNILDIWIKINEDFGESFLFYNYSGIYFVDFGRKIEIPPNYIEAKKIIKSFKKYNKLSCSLCRFSPDSWRCVDCEIYLCRDCFLIKYLKNKGFIVCECGIKGDLLNDEIFDKKYNLLFKNLGL